MQTLQLINPRRRGARRVKARKSRKHRSAAQRAATARLLAFNRARRGGGRAANPRRRRRHTYHARRANPIRRHRWTYARVARRHRRRNPSVRGVMTGIKPVLMGAVGAVGVQAVSNMLSGVLPAQLTSGYGKTAVNFGLAWALGKYGSRVLGHNARTMAAGAMVVLAYQLVRDFASGQGINLGLSGIGSMGPAVIYNPTPALADRFSGMGEYYASGYGGAASSYQTGVSSAAGGMGEYVY